MPPEVGGLHHRYERQPREIGAAAISSLFMPNCPEFILVQGQVYGAAVMCRLRAKGIRDKPIAPASPWQNGYAERLIGSIRRECTDHVVAFGAVRRILQSYTRYYNMWRTHRSLDKDAPIHRVIERFGVVAAQPVLGGLHHRYCRISVFGTHNGPASKPLTVGAIIQFLGAGQHFARAITSSGAGGLGG